MQKAPVCKLTNGGFLIMNKNFEDMAQQSSPYEELADIKREYTKLHNNIYKLCMYTNRLVNQLQLKEQEIEHLHREMYYLAELPQKKEDRNRLHKFVQTTENRPKSSGNINYPFMEPCDFLNMELKRNTNRSRRRHAHMEDFQEGIDYEDTFDGLVDIWHNNQRRNNDGWH